MNSDYKIFCFFQAVEPEISFSVHKTAQNELNNRICSIKAENNKFIPHPFEAAISKQGSSPRMPSDADAMTQKGNVVLYIDRELVEKSKELGFNLSKTFENHLKQLMIQFSTCNSVNKSDSIENKIAVVGLPVPEPKRVQNLIQIRRDNLLISNRGGRKRRLTSLANKVLRIILQKRVRWDALKLLSESLLNKQTATRKESFSVLSKVSRTGLTPESV